MLDDVRSRIPAGVAPLYDLATDEVKDVAGEYLSKAVGADAVRQAEQVVAMLADPSSATPAIAKQLVAGALPPPARLLAGGQDLATLTDPAALLDDPSQLGRKLAEHTLDTSLPAAARLILDDHPLGTLADDPMAAVSQRIQAFVDQLDGQWQQLQSALEDIDADAMPAVMAAFRPIMVLAMAAKIELPGPAAALAAATRPDSSAVAPAEFVCLPCLAQQIANAIAEAQQAGQGAAAKALQNSRAGAGPALPAAAASTSLLEPLVEPGGPTEEPCPQVEIEINCTPSSHDDLVQIKSEYPAQRYKVPCRIRALGGASSATLVLTNPDGRLRFPEAADTSKTLNVPGDGSWVTFEISGEAPSETLNDAVIEAHCHSAQGALKGSKAATVFWFDQAATGLEVGDEFALIGNRSYTVETKNRPEVHDRGGAVKYSAKARIRPAGVNCTAPQVADLRIGIMQDILSYTKMVTWNKPEIEWNADALPGTTVTVEETTRETREFKELPLADRGTTSSVLYGIKDHAVGPLAKPIGCQAEGDCQSTKGIDAPSYIASPYYPNPRRGRQEVKVKGKLVGTVRWTNRTEVKIFQKFRVYCVIYNIHTEGISALCEAEWSVDVNRLDSKSLKAKVSSDKPASHTPVLGGYPANDGDNTAKTTNERVGNEEIRFTK